MGLEQIYRGRNQQLEEVQDYRHEAESWQAADVPQRPPGPRSASPEHVLLVSTRGCTCVEVGSEGEHEQVATNGCGRSVELEAVVHGVGVVNDSCHCAQIVRAVYASAECRQGAVHMIAAAMPLPDRTNCTLT